MWGARVNLTIDLQQVIAALRREISEIKGLRRSHNLTGLRIAVLSRIIWALRATARCSAWSGKDNEVIPCFVWNYQTDTSVNEHVGAKEPLYSIFWGTRICNSQSRSASFQTTPIVKQGWGVVLNKPKGSCVKVVAVVHPPFDTEQAGDSGSPTDFFSVQEGGRIDIKQWSWEKCSFIFTTVHSLKLRDLRFVYIYIINCLYICLIHDKLHVMFCTLSFKSFRKSIVTTLFIVVIFSQFVSSMCWQSFNIWNVRAIKCLISSTSFHLSFVYTDRVLGIYCDRPFLTLANEVCLPAYSCKITILPGRKQTIPIWTIRN